MVGGYWGCLDRNPIPTSCSAASTPEIRRRRDSFSSAIEIACGKWLSYGSTPDYRAGRFEQAIEHLRIAQEIKSRIMLLTRVVCHWQSQWHTASTTVIDCTILSEADRRVENSPGGGQRSGRYTWCFLAMAHHRLGNTDQAQTWLDKAVQWSDTLEQGGYWANTAEIYDPATGTWTAVPSMAYSRRIHTSTLLQNSKVLVVGGARSGENVFHATAEVYDPLT